VAAALGVPLGPNGRILVEPDCSVPGHRNVFAIGDIAHFVPPGSDRPLPGVAPVAMQQGRHVARAIARDLEQRERPRFEYLDKGIMATVGRSRAVAEVGAWRIRGTWAWLAWLIVHLLFLIGFRNRLAVLLNWAWCYLTYGSAARLITGEHAWNRIPELLAAARAELPAGSAPALTASRTDEAVSRTSSS
jgi:NADH dehydrogenase